MSDCCDDKKPESCCEGEAKGRTVLFYACSGGANVAEVADRAARELASRGEGIMFCLAGLGAGIAGMIQTASDADLNVLLDGCDLDCAKRIFDSNKVSNYIQIKVTDLDIEKTKDRRAEDEDVQKVVVKVLDELRKD